MEMTAPADAAGFALDYIFMSVEYEEFIGDSYNDKFYIQLTAPQTTEGETRIINTAECSDPDSYSDVVLPDGTPACYIVINFMFSESCDDVKTNIDGTGFACPFPVIQMVEPLEAVRAG